MRKMTRMEKEQVRIWVALLLLAVFAVYGLIRGMVDAFKWLRSVVYFRPAGETELDADMVLPDSGVGRDTVRMVTLPLYGSGMMERTENRLRVWSEDDDSLPDWWDPDSAELVWVDPEFAEPHPPEGIDRNGIDYNICTTIWGWDGHGAEVWELDLMSRVFYLEFWQPDLTLCEAGCDAILRLWESGEKGNTLGEVLSSKNELGEWTYSVYPRVWTTDYYSDGLEWCRKYCEERFISGPEWVAQYFRLDHYHSTDWSIPAYQIGNVYFSVGKEW